MNRNIEIIADKICQENEELKNINDKLSNALNSAEERLDKAIEYINQHIRIDDEYPSYMELLVEERDELLSILKGENNE